MVEGTKYLFFSHMLCLLFSFSRTYVCLYAHVHLLFRQRYLNDVTFPIDQLSYLAIQFLISILFSVYWKKWSNYNRSNSILNWTIISTITDEIIIFDEPLTNYISQLSKNSTFSKRATEILLSFAVAKGSLKDLLVLFNNHIFNTVEIFNVTSSTWTNEPLSFEKFNRWTFSIHLLGLFKISKYLSQ